MSLSNMHELHIVNAMTVVNNIVVMRFMSLHKLLIFIYDVKIAKKFRTCLIFLIRGKVGGEDKWQRTRICASFARLINIAI